MLFRIRRAVPHQKFSYFRMLIQFLLIYLRFTSNCKSKGSRPIFCILTCLISSGLLAQIEYQNSNHYTHDDGLPSMTTYDIVQDSAGYIWIATEAGISRFNGNQFKNYGLKEGLVRNEVVAMIKDRSGRIWLNSTGPLSYIKNGESVNLEGKSTTNLIWNFQILEDNFGDLWVTAEKEVLLLDGQTFERKDLPSGVTLHSSATQFIGMKNDSLLIKQRDELLFFVDHSIARKIKVPNNLSMDSIRWTKNFLVEDKLYYSGKEGLIRLNLSTMDYKIIDPTIRGARRLEVVNDIIYLSETEKGIYIIKIDAEDNLIKRYKLLENLLCSSFSVDSRLNLWVATYGAGCYMFPKQEKQIIGYPETEYSSFKDLETIYHEKDTIWYGNSKGQLVKQVGDDFKIIDLVTKSVQPIIRSLEINRSNNGNLYISSDHGIFLIKNDKAELKLQTSAKKMHLFGDSLIVSTYNTCFQASDEYFASLRTPLTVYDISENKNFKLLESGRTFTSMVDSKGNKWLGNIEKGLIKITPSGYKVFFKDLSPIYNASITDIVELENGWVCVSTNGEGLLFPENLEFSQIDIDIGLSSDVCFDIEAYGNTIYVATNKGISVIDFDKKGENFYPINIIDQVNGLISNEVRHIEYCKDQLFIASPAGLSIYKISDDFINEESAPLIFETVEINGKERPVKNAYDLKPTENNIVIKFNALNFKHNDQLVYAYRMSGVDKDWIPTRNNETHYSNLKDGEYSFEVRHLNENDGGEIKRINFKVNPTYSNTPLFKIVLGILSLVFFYGFFNLFISRRRSLLLQQMVDEKTLELKQKVLDLADTNDRLKESNEELERFASVTSHDLKSPLRSIGSFLQLFEKKNSKNFDEKDRVYIDYLGSGVKKMDRIIKDLLSLSKVGSHDQEYRMANTKEVILNAIDSLPYIFVESKTECKLIGDFPELMIQRTEFELIFQNLITNGVKYNESEQKTIKISCEEQQDDYRFYVQDNGIGIDPQYADKIFDVFQRLHSDGKYSGTGIGLSICKKIVDKNGGSLWFESDAHGTTFYFDWPKEPINQSRVP